jgi:outer membrane immunogenic protein
MGRDVRVRQQLGVGMSYLLRSLTLAGSIALALSSTDASAGKIVIPALAFGSNSATASSWLAGAHAGYNWQRGQTVFGFEADLQGTHLESRMRGGLTWDLPVPPPPGDFADTRALIDWYGTVRGRLGIANGPWLLYGTAGLAYGNVSLGSSFSTGGLLLQSLASEVKVGWVAGVGVEYLWRPDVSFRLGYQYVDLGTLSLFSSSTNGTIAISQSASAHAQFQAVMAGISWRFAPGGPVMPWQGGYAGVHAGGAWGNDANARYDSGFLPASDARLKRDVALVGRRTDGLGIYAYKYLWSDAVYLGVMAQEVALIHPAAVVRDELTGYMAVNYGMLNGN